MLENKLNHRFYDNVMPMRWPLCLRYVNVVGSIINVVKHVVHVMKRYVIIMYMYIYIYILFFVY